MSPTDVSRIVSDAQVYKVLRAAGWREDRNVDVSLWKEEAERGGFQMFPLALSAWGSLGGLRCKPPDFRESRFSPLAIALDPSECADRWYGVFQYRERQLDCRLAPLGFMEPFFNLVIADDGRLFRDSNKTILRFGDDLYATLRMMIVRESQQKLCPCTIEQGRVRSLGPRVIERLFVDG